MPDDASAAPEKLLDLADLEDGEARALVARVNGRQRNIFVVRRGEGAVAYFNWCPHAQDFLDQIQGQFFNKDHTRLRCGKHGALFDIDSGACVLGPAEGQSLMRVPIAVRDGAVYVEEGS